MERVNLKMNHNLAKNVIIFIGDGMGGTTVTAARILRGQNNGNPGEETVLAFEEFPNVALSKVSVFHCSLVPFPTNTTNILFPRSFVACK